MDTQNILKIIKDNIQIKELLIDFEIEEILIKELSYDDNARFMIEYPQFINDLKLSKPNTENLIPILCLTLIKQDINRKNYSNLKKKKKLKLLL